ncbi:unnamed protein product [Lymnaea stagnalis]|uniref:Uncharacterized protein n=1 Tax=Lymnaea stagnalis TaxID=6523 RepID=A0AAV2IHI9_LYMST
MFTLLLIACLATLSVHGMPHRLNTGVFNGYHSYRLSYAPYSATFKEFQQFFGKVYETFSESNQRFNTFIENIKRIEEHNLKFHNGQVSYFLGLNQFSDLTLDEYHQLNHLGKYSTIKSRALTKCFIYEPKNSAPDAIDWRAKGAVTAVKDQGQCGSCWTFSATGSIEGQNFKNTGKLLSFSEQQIVDCCHGDGCAGCNGGYMDSAFQYINKTGGLELESDYAYTAQDGTCRFSQSLVKVKVTNCLDIKRGDEVHLKDALANAGPVSVAIDASHPSFQSYAGGIYDEKDCSSSELDHGVLVVGYGTQDKADYWIIKNSWGITWGMEGYVLMPRNAKNQCGTATLASFPLTASP